MELPIGARFRTPGWKALRLLLENLQVLPGWARQGLSSLVREVSAPQRGSNGKALDPKMSGPAQDMQARDREVGGQRNAMQATVRDLVWAGTHIPPPATDTAAMQVLINAWDSVAMSRSKGDWQGHSYHGGDGRR